MGPMDKCTRSEIHPSHTTVMLLMRLLSERETRKKVKAT